MLALWWRDFKRMVQQGANRKEGIIIGSVFACLLLLMWLRGHHGSSTLVIYVYQPRTDDVEYTNNVKYFIREGIQPNDGNDYIIVVQRDSKTKLPSLPDLPRNARYIHHRNECFDLGTAGWVLRYHVKLRKYKYFFFLNSGVRGPFMPAYAWERRMHWLDSFTSKIKGPVKMVGPTINCGGAFSIDAIPHVQSYAFAVDRRGLAILKDAGVFSCFEDWETAISYGELGAAKAIFDSGYTIDCLMLRYQGVDWRDSQANGCNAGMQPIQNDMYDAGNVHPLEVMFVKVKSSMITAKWQTAWDAAQYDAWRAQEHLPMYRRLPLLKSNQFKNRAPERIEFFKKRGSQCFDADFYINSNFQDLKVLQGTADPVEAAWNHFINYGYVEGRPHRFTC